MTHPLLLEQLRSLQLDTHTPPSSEQWQHFLHQVEQAYTEQHHAKETAEAANHAKSTFLTTMSHELRTPLAAIIGYSEMLQEQCKEPDLSHLTPKLRQIEGAAQQLLAIINDILDLSKIETGHTDLFYEQFSLPQLIEEVLHTVRPLIEKKHNQLELTLSPQIGIIYADQAKVRQILLNLLSNAGKFTYQGKICLSVQPDIPNQNNRICLAVSDDGIGMTQSQIQRLFQPFVQVDSSAARKYGGSGLGLAISQKFCQMMGGQITVQSIIGQGTKFTVYLPLTEHSTSPLVGIHKTVLTS